MSFKFLATLAATGIIFVLFIFSKRGKAPPIPVSVNYHLTRKCNYECGFCFHTAKTSYILPLEEAKKGLALLKQGGMKKLNFVGGEPMMYPNFVGELAKYCKEQLALESVSIVTNGSLVKERFLTTYGTFIDIIAVSCDSFHEATNIKIGRGEGSHLEKFILLRAICQKHGIKFKVNTVVNKYNVDEDMREAIARIEPFRWKCFQVLVVKGENDSADTLRDATHFTISDEQFEQFCAKHSTCSGFVPEPNNIMKDSYLILDEYMRFLDKGNDPSKSIFEVGVSEALRSIFWDEKSFLERGGIYDWTRAGDKDKKLDCWRINVTMPLYEIEQKFAFNPALLSRLRQNRGQPPFRHLVRQNTSTFQDEYFDSANVLSKKGLWIRKRNGAWEAKRLESGDFLRSTFYETSDIDEIRSMIDKCLITSSISKPGNNFGLKSICRYRTERETFVADRQFSIMLDSTDFGHWVGEVELQRDDEVEATSEIDRFMKTYSWFFTSGVVPRGKMTAYFERFGFPSETL
ncbi:Radical S-adenosyl methionine domain-containing protein [Lachnellula suecica]|uniref:Radical S-adenosyl methionine domain-containing protein n=1 Tax=Lachnellula suecica TaxID=602035 RepID=A0A8T9CHZ1_9HELO|nr:Radical S-adenosyl methionine domain-containing protein [Lachnellula suecica]